MDDTFSDDITSHDTTKDVHQDSFHVLVIGQQLEGFSHTLHIGSSAYIQEVGRFSTMQFDNIHGCHCQTSAIYQTTNTSIHANIRETKVFSTHITRVLLSGVTHGEHLLLTEERIVIKVDLGIDSEHTLVVSLHQRVDLNLCGVTVDEEIVKTTHLLLGGSDHLLTLKAHALSQTTRLFRLRPQNHIHTLLVDLFRGVLGYLLNVHATVRAGHHYRTVVGTIHQNGKVELTRELERLSHHHLAHQHTILGCLFGV
mmetsp:Transcript_30542/g.76647  ORF Transcript_30542/g.76647 Transcript_30542/m.76647 type:complete len:255 (+) Transcript_30542:208-972(+)